jgi:uncharacterized membrane protein
MLDTLKHPPVVPLPMLSRRDIAGGAIVLLTAVASVLAAPDLPGEMAIHFDASGSPDRYTDRSLALAFGPLVGLALVVLFAALPRIDPLGENVAEFRDAYDAVAVTSVALIAYVHGLMIAYNMDLAVNVTVAIAPAIAVLYYVVGVLLDRAERNWFVGLRTPWTLSDERVWNRTHDRVAPLFKVAGVAALGALLDPSLAVYWLVAPVLVASLAGVVYSFVCYRRLNPA